MGAGAVRHRADRGQLLLLHRTSAPTCCPPWTKAASLWTTSCRPAHRSQETNRVITHIEKILRATPEVENIRAAPAWSLGLRR